MHLEPWTHCGPLSSSLENSDKMSHFHLPFSIIHYYGAVYSYFSQCILRIPLVKVVEPHILI